MGDMISYSVADYYGNEVICGSVSVAEYAFHLPAYHPTYAGLCDALLTYGAAAQIYFGHNVERLVSDRDLSSLAAVEGERFDAASVKADMENDPTVPVVYCAMNVTFDAYTALSVAFRIKDDFTDTAALSWVDTNVSFEGQSCTGVLSYDLLNCDDRFVTVSLQNISLTDLDRVFDLTAGDRTLGISILQYLTAAEDSENDCLKHLTRALYAYSCTAKNIFD
jgi:hypothetical protein